jgi:hypothetical protein
MDIFLLVKQKYLVLKLFFLQEKKIITNLNILKIFIAY